MAMTMTENVGSTLQKGLSEWWSEETEYVFQRIERWAAFARGYNRLRSQRLSRGRLTMQEEQEPRWSISANKLIIDDSSWSPRFHTLKRSRRKSRPEETKINCCGTFNYQSNSNLDSTCLETYRYDHSIYFKTIGDIRNSKKAQADRTEKREDRISISSEELVEWDAGSVSEATPSQLLEEEASSDKKSSFDSLDGPPQDFDSNDPSTWPIVDLSKLDLNPTEENTPVVPSTDELNNEISQNDESNLTVLRNVVDDKVDNNNYIEYEECTVSLPLESQRQSKTNKEEGYKEEQKNQEGLKRFLSCRKSRRMSRSVKQPPVVGDNNVIWPGVLLNYTKNINPVSSPHHHRAPQK